jgi:hypothetical protein
MKKIKIILALFIVFCCFSCKQNETEMKGGVVPYAPCSCEKDETVYPISGDAILFNDSIPAQYGWEIWQELDQDHDKEINWIIYDSQTDRARVYRGRPPLFGISEICNYPDFAKKWNIPLNGRLVYFEGTRHSSCVPKYGLDFIIHFDIILTILKLE